MSDYTEMLRYIDTVVEYGNLLCDNCEIPTDECVCDWLDETHIDYYAESSLFGDC